MTDFTPEGKRGPGRPRKDEQDKPDTRASQDKRQRRRRDDMGAGRLLRLHIPMQARDPNCEHRWINDTVGGRLVCPTGSRDLQTLRTLVRTSEGLEETASIRCVFVPLIGKDGWPG